MARPKKTNGTEDQAAVVQAETAETEIVPTMNDPEWTTYVLSQLDEKTELVEKRPKAAGLRRIFTPLTGWIVRKSYPTVIQAPEPNNERRATVMFTLVIDTPQGQMEYSDASDCYWANTTKPYNLHPVATAATMAEGRVLRKLMKLNCVTVEETLQPTEDEAEINEAITDASTPIEKPQEVAIEQICGKAGIDIRKMLMWHKMPVPENTSDKPTSKMSKRDAQQIIQICLQGYQRGKANGGIDIPEEIKRGNK